MNKLSIYDSVGLSIGELLIQGCFNILCHNKDIHMYGGVPIIARHIQFGNDGIQPMVIIFDKNKPLKIQQIIIANGYSDRVYFGKDVNNIHHYYPHDKVGWDALFKWSTLEQVLMDIEHLYYTDKTMNRVYAWRKIPRYTFGVSW